ncbi:MAG: hypothetical protein D6788_05375 [Planctomycetota bacterium]|nr:MAG: hypothetical protein D6788_05375 [Planctomycetota bacterium]
MHRPARFVRWLLVVCSAGLAPAFFLRCDKAAINFQRGFFWQLGFNTANQLFSAIPTDTGQ